MRSIQIFTLLLFTHTALANECITDPAQQYFDDGVEEIRQFDDLNHDGKPETLLLLTGSMRSRYAIIFMQDDSGCFIELYSGSEAVAVTTISADASIRNRMKGELYNGFSLLHDSSWGGEETSTMVYAYDVDQRRYRMVLSTTEYGWFW